MKVVSRLPGPWQFAESRFNSTSFFDRSKAGLIGAGLENLGNTCFLNSVVQCLFHTVPLVKAFCSLDHKSSCSSDEEDFCSLCAMHDLMVECLLSSGGVVEPEVLVKNLSNISSSFRRFQQEDAHEFLHGLLDSLDSSYTKLGSDDRPSSLSDSSFIQQIFGGRLLSQVQCCDCGHRSDTFEPLLDLSLEIEDADSLGDALKSFTKVERIDDPETKFTCESCKAQVSVKKQLKLDQVPTVIALHLKRFKINGFCYAKLDKHVSYPVELDLKPFVSTLQDEVELKYDLYAVVVHRGMTSFSGHYYCFVRTSPDVWHEMDDSTVDRVPESRVLDQSAYILFYVKQGSSPWFSSLIEEYQMRDAFRKIQTKTSPSSVLDCLEPVHASSSDGENPTDESMEALKEGGNEHTSSDDGSTESPTHDLGIEHGPSIVKVPEPCILDNNQGDDGMESSCAQFSAMLPPPISASPNTCPVDVFSDEPLEDEKENNSILPWTSTKAVLPQPSKVTQPSIKVKQNNRRCESISRQLRQMGSSRRQALAKFLPPSIASNSSPENQTRKRRTNSLLAESEDRSRSPPTGKAEAATISIQSSFARSALHDLVAESDSIVAMHQVSPKTKRD